MKKLPTPPKPRSLPTKHRDKPRPREASTSNRAGQNVLDHSYDPKTGHLIVTFRGNLQYRYKGIDPKLAAEFAKSDSKGSFLHKHIIPHDKGSKIDP